MTPEDKNQILAWQEQHGEPIQITLIKTGDGRSLQLRSFLDTLADLAPLITIKVEKEEGGMPAIRIRENIFYHALPEGPELSLFLKALSVFSGKAVAEVFSPYQDPGQLPVPAHLKIFIAPHCPHCPFQVEPLLSLACSAGSIHLEVIDGVLFEEVSRKYQVQSAPTVILDDTVTWTGRTPVHEILSMVRDRDPAGMGRATLEGMLTNNEAFKLAEMMIEKKKIFPSLIDVMEKSPWQIRLGAMVVIETIAEEDIGLAREALGPLFQRLPEMKDEKAKGDIVYLAGICGDETILPALEEMMGKEHLDEELREAIEEAISAIRERV